MLRSSARARRIWLHAALGSAALLASGCHTTHHPRNPIIHFIQVPRHVAVGGPHDVGRFEGTITDNRPGTKLLLYSLTEGTWWVQPFRSQGVTKVAPDGTWSNHSHLGERYAALLVTANYRMSVRLSSLPPLGGDVLAEATSAGDYTPQPPPKIVHFSGYDWKVRSGSGDTGGSFCEYEESNVWLDDKDYLHLLMNGEGGDWHCAGLLLTHSLGYGTYHFVVGDSTHFPPSATFDMFLRPDHEDPDERSGFSVALGQGGKAASPNVDFIVQPYYVPGNSIRFNAPAGVMSYVLRWEPGIATFKSFSGASPTQRGVVREEVFRSGIPVPAEETVHFNFYDFHHSQSGLQHPVEIVVQKFEYLP